MSRLVVFNIVVIMFLTTCENSFSNTKDSIVNIIKSSEKSYYLKTIKTKVGPKIQSLNSWAKSVSWNSPDLVRDVTDELILYSIKEKNDSLLSWSYHYNALAYYYMDYYKLSNLIYHKAISTNWAKTSPTAASFNAFCTLNIGCNYQSLGEYDKAAENFYKSINLNEQLNLPYVVAEVQLDLAQLNISIGNYDEARVNISKSIDVLKEYQDSVRVSESYRYLAIIDVFEGKYDEAEFNFQNALKINIVLKDNERLAKLYITYGEAFFKRKMYVKALSYFKKALMYCSYDIIPSTYYRALSGLGKVYLYLNNYAEAEKNLLKSYNGLQKVSAKEFSSDVANIFSDLYAKKGEFEKYEFYKKIYLNRRDSINRKDKLRSIAEAEIIYETDKKDRKIEYQKSRLVFIRNQNILFLTIAILMLTGFLIVLILLRRIKYKNRVLFDKNKELTEQWNRLQNNYKEKSKENAESDLFKGIYSFVVEKQGYINSKLTVNDIARELSSNNKYVSKTIKETTGMNFNTFINTYRVEKAKKLLRSEDANKWSLEVIAETCGFNNSTTFYQTFKNQTGLTPSIYRNIEVRGN